MSVIKLQPQRISGVKRIIGIMSGKGGVGKSFIASNLALQCAKSGLTIGVLDADIHFPDLFTFYGINSRITPTSDNKLLPPEKFGVKLMSMAGLLEKNDDPTMWRGTIMTKIIQQLTKETLWGELDVLYIDFPTGLADHVIHTLQTVFIDGVILVTTADQIALHNTRRSIKALQLLDIPVIGVVENMRGEIFGEGSTQRLCEVFQIHLLASIPLRRAFISAMENNKLPVLESDELTIIMNKMVRYITEKVVTNQLNN